MTPTDTYLGLRAFADELARCGVREACTSPGSRSTPLVLSLTAEARIRSTSHVDERSGAFYALGLAKAGGMPAVLACTSGTAAANYLPAVVEAHEARVPMIVLTADRPPELRELGAGQTIDQLKLYGSAAKWFADVDDHAATPERLRWLRQLACRAVWTALDGRPGPVHVNFAFREPLVLDAPLPAEDPVPGRPGGRPWVSRIRAATVPVGGALATVLGTRRRPLLVAGRAERDAGLGPALAAFAARAGIPLLADPLSGGRRGPAAIAHYDALLRDPAFAAAHAPDLVLRVGDLPTSGVTRRWLAGLEGAVQLAFDPDSAWQDPAGAVATVLPGEPRAALESADPAPADPAWLAAWRAADDAAGRAIAELLDAEPALTEPRVAAELGARLPADATLTVAASMPVRDVETFFGARPDAPRVLANRGANGIDGTLSTALGAAAASAGPGVLLTGDVALLHDLGGGLAGPRLGARLTVVLIDNDGGGIFHFLPVSGAGPAFEEHVATPHGIDFERVAALFGWGYARAGTPAELGDALAAGLAADGVSLVHVRTDRAANVDVHRRLWAAVAAAVRAT